MIAQHSVVVGVDGSGPSLDAVAWAAADAARRGRPLHILHAFVWPAIYGPLAPPSPAAYERELREMAMRTVALAEARARGTAPGLSITTSLEVQAATSALLDAADRADSIVVGNRGLGGFAGLLLGSVGGQLAAHAGCPVVVVRHEERPPGPEAGRVVVGVDGSHEADRALWFGFEQASYGGCGLTAVLAYQWPSSTGPGDMLPLAYDHAALAEDERRALAESTAGWSGKYPDVDFRSSVVDGRPAARLAEMSAGARLLVVGSRGRGGFTGLLLGSVSQAVLHHAACPVAVVR